MTTNTPVFASSIVLLSSLVSLAACDLDADIARAPSGAPGSSSDASAGADASSGSTDAATSSSDAGTDATSSAGGWKPVAFVPGGGVFAGAAGTPSTVYLQPYAIFQSTSAGSCEERAVAAAGGVTCKVQRCKPGSAPATYPHAGPIDFGGLVTLQPGPNGAYLLSGESPAWNAGTAITVSAKGAAVPAFSRTIELPLDLVVTTPAGGSPNVKNPLPQPLSKSAGLPVAWAPGPGTIRVQVLESYSSPKPTDQPYTVICDVPRTAGSFSVPAAALSDLSIVPLTSGGPHVDVEVSPFYEQDETIDGWRIGFLGMGRGVVMSATNQVVP